MGRALCSPRSKPAVPANFPAVPPAAAIFRQHLELATILAGGAAADTARLAKSAVFAAVTSKSGRLDQPVGAPIGRSPRFANGLVSQPAGPLVLHYAIGANPLAARVSGIDVERHIVLVYMMAGLLSGLSGIVHTARAISGQAGVGVGFELAAIAAAVIGGTSLSGGVGRMTGTVIGAVILGVLTSGFTFLNVDAHYQEIIKGGVIVAAVVADQYRQRRRKGA